MSKEDLKKQIELLVRDDESNQQTITNQKEEIERLKDEILTLETERDILKGKLSETKADIHYLLENGENIYIRNKYIRSDKE